MRRILGLSVLHGPGGGTGTGDVLTVSDAPGPTAQDVTWCCEWLAGRSLPWPRIGRFRGGYVLEFPGVADFTVTPEAIIRHPYDKSVDQASLDHLLYDLVLPLAVSLRGHLVLHSSIIRRDGKSLLLAALSGVGKSTLAASALGRGWEVLGDDAARIVPAPCGLPGLLTGAPGLRLWPDTVAALLPGDIASTRVAGYSTKVRVDCGPGASETPARLHAIVLCESADPAQASVIAQSRAADTLVALTPHLFLADPEDEVITTALFQQLADLLERVPAFQLRVPRSFKRLPEVLDVLEQLAADLPSA